MPSPQVSSSLHFCRWSRSVAPIALLTFIASLLCYPSCGEDAAVELDANGQVVHAHPWDLWSEVLGPEHRHHAHSYRQHASHPYHAVNNHHQHASRREHARHPQRTLNQYSYVLDKPESDLQAMVTSETRLLAAQKLHSKRAGSRSHTTASVMRNSKSTLQAHALSVDGTGTDAKYPEPFVIVGSRTADSCREGDSVVTEASCVKAAQSVLVNASEESMTFLVGDGTGRPASSWGSVPSGCSVKLSDDNTSVEIYYNSGQGRNSGEYRLVCLQGDFVGGGHCKEGLLRGWDGHGLTSPRDCIEVCRSEPDCGWVSYCPASNPSCRYNERGAEGTCSRYRRDALCAPLYQETDHAKAFDTYLVPGRAIMTFAEADNNGDRVVNREEFLRQELQDAASQARARVVFEELDSNLDGVLNREEFFSQGIRQLATHVGDLDALINLFFYMDENGDKKLSYHELVSSMGSSSHQLREAQTFFRGSDRDGDGLISRDEFLESAQNGEVQKWYRDH